jgi:hypothetical protein
LEISAQKATSALKDQHIQYPAQMEHSPTNQDLMNVSHASLVTTALLNHLISLNLLVRWVIIALQELDIPTSSLAQLAPFTTLPMHNQ